MILWFLVYPPLGVEPLSPGLKRLEHYAEKILRLVSKLRMHEEHSHRSNMFRNAAFNYAEPTIYNLEAYQRNIRFVAYIDKEGLSIFLSLITEFA